MLGRVGGAKVREERGDARRDEAAGRCGMASGRGGEVERRREGDVSARRGGRCAPARCASANTTRAHHKCNALVFTPAAAEESRSRRRRGKIMREPPASLSPPPPTRLTSIFCLESPTTHTTTHTSLVSHSHRSGHSAKHRPAARSLREPLRSHGAAEQDADPAPVPRLHAQRTELRECSSFWCQLCGTEESEGRRRAVPGARDTHDESVAWPQRREAGWRCACRGCCADDERGRRTPLCRATAPMLPFGACAAAEAALEATHGTGVPASEGAGARRPRSKTKGKTDASAD
jgi:hypothetical protein